MKLLITGAAGFIGYHLVKRLLSDSSNNFEIIGLDNINDYYSRQLKYDRLKRLTDNFPDKSWTFIEGDITDTALTNELFSNNDFDLVINLAAQAGVRYSIENPMAYITSNILGFANILECCRNHNIHKVIYASSSSVYGNTATAPFSEEENVNSPESLYAATKLSDELIAKTYTKIYGMQTIGLRFFTVYGPWGRPDMAPMLFMDAIVNNKHIKVFNNGELKRDFTYVDDIVNGIYNIVVSDKTESGVYNIGHGEPVNLMDFISLIEKYAGKKADKVFMPMQQGDVYQTYADTRKFAADYNYKPAVPIEEGVRRFAEWFKDYYNKKLR